MGGAWRGAGGGGGGGGWGLCKMKMGKAKYAKLYSDLLCAGFLGHRPLRTGVLDSSGLITEPWVTYIAAYYMVHRHINNCMSVVVAVATGAQRMRTIIPHTMQS